MKSSRRNPKLESADLDLRRQLWNERNRNRELQAQVDLMDLRFVKLVLAPDDFLIFKTDAILTQAQVTQLRNQIGKQLPGVKSMLVAGGIEVAKLHGKDVPLDWQSAWEPMK